MSTAAVSLSCSVHIVGSSVVGPLHIQMALPCQDACAFQSLGPGVGIIAVADGLGSATRSDEGARLAVDIAVQSGTALLGKDDSGVNSLSEIAGAAVKDARDGLTSRASAERCPLRDFACTIIVVAIRKNEMAVGHIGDGGVVAQTGNGLHLVSGPGDSEYTNEVVPLTSDQWQPSLRVVELHEDIRAIAVFTDGCQRAIFRRSADRVEPFAGFLNPIFDYVREQTDPAEAERELSALLTSKKLCTNSEDDKTLVIAVMSANEGPR